MFPEYRGAYGYRHTKHKKLFGIIIGSRYFADYIKGVGMMNTDFNVKFGHVGYLMSDGGLSYEKADTGELFLFLKK